MFSKHINEYHYGVGAGKYKDDTTDLDSVSQGRLMSGYELS